MWDACSATSRACSSVAAGKKPFMAFANCFDSWGVMGFTAVKLVECLIETLLRSFPRRQRCRSRLGMSQRPLFRVVVVPALVEPRRRVGGPLPLIGVRRMEFGADVGVELR